MPLRATCCYAGGNPLVPCRAQVRGMNAPRGGTSAATGGLTAHDHESTTEETP